MAERGEISLQVQFFDFASSKIPAYRDDFVRPQDIYLDVKLVSMPLELNGAVAARNKLRCRDTFDIQTFDQIRGELCARKTNRETCITVPPRLQRGKPVESIFQFCHPTRTWLRDSDPHIARE